ncbi:MAG: alpha/beta hydrolase [Candidatus Dormibacteraeota bacterium]|nr:alpha/beta hydrolase [Candidatus Dormibacteraeota bacterium]
MPVGAAGRSQVGFADVNGVKLHYEVGGEGTSLVLVHSGITDSRSWEPQFPAFTRTYRVLRYDMRGFGQSDIAHGKYSSIDDLAAILGTVGTAPAALLGVSVGGSIALDTALQHPEMVTALILVGSGISGRKHSAQYDQMIDEIDQLVVDKGMDAAIDREMEVWLYGRGRTEEDVDPQVRAAVREMDFYNSARYPPDAEPQRIQPPAIGRLDEIRVPTLVIIGERDVEDVRQAAEELERGIRGATLMVMQGVAHVPNMERPEEFNRLVLDFLDSVT